MAQEKDWILGFKAEFTVQKTPQQNSIAKTAFTVIVAQARSMMCAAQLHNKLRFKLWAETVMTATYLNNLVIVTINRKENTMGACRIQVATVDKESLYISRSRLN
jgi:hypothetical protein